MAEDLFARKSRRKFAALSDEVRQLRVSRGLPSHGSACVSMSMWKKCSPVRVLLAKAGLTFVAAAEGYCIDERTLRRLANGDHIPRPETLRNVASALGAEPAALWAEHVIWLSFRPTLDAYAMRKAAMGARRLVHPIHRAYKRAGMSIATLADDSGVTTGTIRKCWGLTRSPGISTLVALARALDLDLGILVEQIDHWHQSLVGQSDTDTLGIAAVLEQELDEWRL